MHSRLRPVGLRPVGVAVLLSLGLVLAGCSSDATGDAAPAGRASDAPSEPGGTTPSASDSPAAGSDQRRD